MAQRIAAKIITANSAVANSSIVQFTVAKFTMVKLAIANLTAVKFVIAKLTIAKLTIVNLTVVKVTVAKLAMVTLAIAKFTMKFTMVKIAVANLTMAKLAITKLTLAKFVYVVLWGCTFLCTWWSHLCNFGVLWEIQGRLGDETDPLPYPECPVDPVELVIVQEVIVEEVPEKAPPRPVSWDDVIEDRKDYNLETLNGKVEWKLDRGIPAFKGMPYYQAASRGVALFKGVPHYLAATQGVELDVSLGIPNIDFEASAVVKGVKSVTWTSAAVFYSLGYVCSAIPPAIYGAMDNAHYVQEAYFTIDRALRPCGVNPLCEISPRSLASQACDFIDSGRTEWLTSRDLEISARHPNRDRGELYKTPQTVATWKDCQEEMSRAQYWNVAYNANMRDGRELLSAGVLRDRLADLSYRAEYI